MELGGIYFFVNALMNVLSWFVAAVLYSLHYPTVIAEPAHGVNVSTLVSTVNFSANLTGANLTNAVMTGANMTGVELTGATMPDGSLHD